MTIEDRAVKEWGCTEQPRYAIWILADGSMVNGCMGGYVRDVDHSEIGQFFRTSKFHDPGSNYLYIKKFVRRGNVRTSCEGECYFQFARTPTKAQYAAMRRCMMYAAREGKPVMIEKLVPGRNGPCWRSREDFEAYLARYAPHVL